MRRRLFLCGCAAAACATTAPARAALPPISMVRHEQAMRQAIEEARRNPVYPFGAVIVRADNGEVLARGVNNSRESPILHGEIACMNDYVRLNGNKGWGKAVLYTTGEPCSMCMSALVWAGIGGVVFASSIDGIKRAGIEQIEITARAVADATSFWKGLLLGGVLAAETDRMFMERARSIR
jgi:tRNA(adenine34) deaminase